MEWCLQTDSDSWSSIKPIGMHVVCSMDGKCLHRMFFAHAEKVRFFLSSRQCIVVPACRSFLLHGWMALNDAMDMISMTNIIQPPHSFGKDFSFGSLVTWPNPTWLRGVLLIIGAECSPVDCFFSINIVI